MAVPARAPEYPSSNKKNHAIGCYNQLAMTMTTMTMTMGVTTVTMVTMTMSFIFPSLRRRDPPRGGWSVDVLEGRSMWLGCYSPLVLQPVSKHVMAGCYSRLLQPLSLGFTVAVAVAPAELVGRHL